jgi:uncharacterized RDD family membrane protein YckC
MQEEIDISKLSLASMNKRAKAFIIDDLIITFLVFILLWDKIAISNGNFIVIMDIMNQAVLQILVLKFLYHTFFIWYYGATLGKYLVKVRVIDYDNFGKVSLINSAIRSMGRLLSEAVFYLGFILAYYTEAKQTFHDKLGRTLVVDAN